MTLCLLARTNYVKVIFSQKSWQKMACTTFTPLPKVIESCKSKRRGPSSSRISPLRPKIRSSSKTGSLSFFQTKLFDCLTKKSYRTFCNFFQCRKTKCWGSSEMRFPKIWGRMEPSSGKKQPFKVLLIFGQNRLRRRDLIFEKKINERKSVRTNKRTKRKKIFSTVKN